VYLYTDKSETQSRSRYLVVSVDGEYNPREDNPFRSSLELSRAVATASVSSDNSSSNSAIAFSATGFLFGFFTRPTSTKIPEKPYSTVVR
jgi:hypothetical protein